MSDEADREDRSSRLVDGDRLALEQMLFGCHERLLHHIREKLPTSLRSVVDVDDILQLTYVAAFRGVGQFQARTEPAFYRWLATIAENQVLDAIKAKQRKKRGGDFRRIEQPGAGEASSMANLLEEISTGGGSPSAIVAGDEGIKALQVAMAGLADDHRQVIRLSCLEGKSLDVAAEEMGRPRDAIRGLLYRAKKNLRDAMGQSSLWFSRQ